MNNIIFRGKQKYGDEWIKGNLIQYYGGYVAMGSLNGHDDLKYEVYPKSVAMNTGLNDKNDKQIFGSIPVNDEMSKGGDIIEWKGRGKVRFDNEFKKCTSHIIFKHARWYPEPINVSGLRSIDLNLFSNEKCKIIGNPFDNPKLLEE